jgi:oligoendopeptidase F
VPADLDAGRWENLQPLYRALVDRELKCAGCLEQLLLDRSDLDAAAREAHVNLYIDMTCHTDSEQAKAAYLDFVEHVEPKLKQVGFDLDRKVVGSPHGGDLEPRRYEVLLRDLRADVEIFREENIPLQTEETKLDQQYEETCGAMTVEFLGEERTLPQMGRFFEETDRSTREAAWRGTWERRRLHAGRLRGVPPGGRGRVRPAAAIAGRPAGRRPEPGSAAPLGPGGGHQGPDAAAAVRAVRGSDRKDLRALPPHGPGAR